MRKLGLYIHIPFCIKKCNYCGFSSFDNCTSQEEADYVFALIKEISMYGKVFANKAVVDTIFIGGGTPTILPENAMVALMAAIYTNFKVTDNAEITIEANPKTLSYTKLNAYKKAGINRISIGAQSFHREELEILGRIHTPQEIYEAIRMSRDCGFENINLDFIFGVPGQTEETWAATLGVAARLRPEHISTYSLEIEENTPFYSMLKHDKIELPSEVDDRVMYHFARASLEKEGYNYYEISNCALPGYECKHNLKYWSMDEYVGMGLGASSFVNGKRAKNLESISEYINALNRDMFPFASANKNSDFDNMSEYVFLGLRKTEGINLVDFKERFGVEFKEAFKDSMAELYKYEIDGFVEMIDDTLKLTVKGIDVSNSILSLFV